MKSAQIATVVVQLRNPGAQDITSEAAACDWFSGLLSEDNDNVLDWAYLRIGGQLLAPRKLEDHFFNSVIQLLMPDNINAHEVISNMFNHLDVHMWQYATISGCGLTPQITYISDNYEEGDFLNG